VTFSNIEPVIGSQLCLRRLKILRGHVKIIGKRRRKQETKIPPKFGANLMR
jgi:hypothetical protein